MTKTNDKSVSKVATALVASELGSLVKKLSKVKSHGDIYPFSDNTYSFCDEVTCKYFSEILKLIEDAGIKVTSKAVLENLLKDECQWEEYILDIFDIANEETLI